MKRLFFTGICLVTMAVSAWGQLSLSPKAVLPSYAIEIAWNKTTVLVFPAEVKSADRGTADILAQKDQAASNILKLKAGRRNFEESNLNVVTADGNLYSFTVNYDDHPKALSIDLSKQKEVETLRVLLKNAEMNKRKLTGFAKVVIGKPGFLRKSETESKIRLKLSGIYIRGDVMFFRFHLKNRSRIDYDIDQWRFTVKDRKQVKRTAERSRPIKPLHIQYKKEPGISGKNENIMVVAFTKFTIADAKELTVQLFEKSGDRNPELQVKGRHILKARPVILIKKNR